MNAARAISRAGLDTDAVRLAIHPIHPESVNLYPASPLLRSLWGNGISAITLWRWVFVDPEVLVGDEEMLGRLTLHELIHLRQISDMGLGRFLWRYLRDYVRGRSHKLGHHESYRGIGLEREARELTVDLSRSGPR